MALDPVQKLHRFNDLPGLLKEAKWVHPLLVPWQQQPNVQRLFRVTEEHRKFLPTTFAAIEEVRALGFAATCVCYRELAPSACYTWHTDKNNTSTGFAFHLPIISRPGTFLAYEDGLHYLEPGYFYRIDVARMHSYFNGAVDVERFDDGSHKLIFTPRLHLHFEDPNL